MGEVAEGCSMSLDYPLYTRRPRHRDDTVWAWALVAFVVAVIVVAMWRKG